MSEGHTFVFSRNYIRYHIASGEGIGEDVVRCKSQINYKIYVVNYFVLYAIFLGEATFVSIFIMNTGDSAYGDK